LESYEEGSREEDVKQAEKLDFFFATGNNLLVVGHFGDVTKISKQLM